jgi:enoyl-CoA hydratase/carnithine racemase
MNALIEVSRSGGVQILRIMRPERKNALTGAMYRALSDALEAGEASAEIAAHVIFGSNGIFSAGNDIADFLATAQGEAGLGPDVLRFIRLLPALEKPLLAGVDGPAVGIGTTLLLHCDLVYASPAAIFSTPFLDLGLVPEAASSLLMPRAMGHVRAFEMLALGEPFSAERALHSGLINGIVPADRLEDVVIAAAVRLANKPPEALRLARRLLKGDPAATRARMDEEAALFTERLRSPEALAAFQAFLGKRGPRAES